MAYQPMYAAVSDNQGFRRTTSSQRGKVNTVSAWINSCLGSVMTVTARYLNDSILDAEEKVVVNIDLEPNVKFQIRINGQPIPIKRLQQIQEVEAARFEVQLKALTKLRDSGKNVQMLQLAKQIMEQ